MRRFLSALALCCACAALAADAASQTDKAALPIVSNRPGNAIRFPSLVHDRAFGLCVMGIGGHNVEKPTDTANNSGYVYPAWSPDGKKIAWADKTNNGLQIFVADADGKNAKQITKDPGL